MKEDLLAITHLGDDYGEYMNAIVPPVFMNSLHIFDSMEDYLKADSADSGVFTYGRVSNPTVQILESKLAALEHGKKGIVFASGMGAASAAILGTCKAGSHIICMRNVYSSLRKIINSYFVPKLNMTVTYWAGKDLKQLEKMIRPETDLIMIESPSTFVFKVVDIVGVAEIAKRHKVRTYIDNTYCTPLFQKPLDLGIDIVMHTISKYIGGHSDMIGGILVTNDVELGKELQFEIRVYFGGVIGPMEAWLAIRGLRTMQVRLHTHQETGMEVARFLEKHERVEKVYYTGLPSHPQADIIAKQQSGHTGLLSFVLKDKPEEAIKVVNKLKIFKIGCSWGGFESLVLCPLYDATDEVIQFMNIRPQDRGLIRIHCGLEGKDNLIEDLNQALNKNEM
ncbi:MAG: PLP-dependent aspartate aminotransferase family protein [Lachnospiraceae bacterium]|nr:PLP-dependent aspartate aminotransferase family protein [Lachnospiraceae bacterium]